MTILVTGGTGKTGGRVAAQLGRAGIAHRVVSRHSPVAFDWTDRATWAKALDGVTAIYLVAPPSGATPEVIIGLVKDAQQRGVARFVLLSASVLEPGGPGTGMVHGFLADNAKEWAVMRPGWFMQNFTEGQQIGSIRAEGAIYSAAGDGRIAFINAEDIAAGAVAALTAKTAPNADFILTGPRALSYDEAAALISKAAGRTIVHRRVSVDEMAQQHQARGLAPFASQMLAMMDVALSNGIEDRTTDDVQKLTGRPPISFEDFVRDNAAVWKA
jgi:ergot alkaloid biosynthesis protein